MIAKGNYGQTEGVFLCLLSFAREKKVRRPPGATGITALYLKKHKTQGLRPLPSPYSFCSHKMSKQKNAPQCLARYAGIR